MNKLEYLAFTATMIFAVCWIGNCCQAAASEESEVAVIYLKETPTIEEMPNLTDLNGNRAEMVVSTGDGRTVVLNSDAEVEHGRVEIIHRPQQPADRFIELKTTVIEDDISEEECVEPEPAYTYYASYEITAYIWTGNPCADGVYPSVGYTVASNDPALWHKWIYIEGIGDRYVHDTGGMASNVIDLFVGSYTEAIQFGRQVRGIYIYE